MRRHGLSINLGAGPRGAYALRDVEDDTGEAVLVDVYLLVIGYLPQLAVWPASESRAGQQVK